MVEATKIDYIVKEAFSKIVDTPSDLKAESEFTEDSIKVTIYAANGDTGTVIGKQGRNIKAIRNLLASYALVNDDKRKIFIEAKSVYNQEATKKHKGNEDQSVILAALIKGVFQHIVEYPDDLDVNVHQAERVTVTTISPHSADVGKVIGRNGQNVNAIKTLFDSYAISRNDKRKFYLEVKSD